MMTPVVVRMEVGRLVEWVEMAVMVCLSLWMCL